MRSACLGAALLGAALAGPAASQGRLSFVQLGPDDEPMAIFEAPCGTARCFGAARLETPDGPVWIEAAAARQGRVILVAVRDDDARISTAGAERVLIEGGRAASTISLVRGWSPGDPSRAVEPAGVRLRVAYGP